MASPKVSVVIPCHDPGRDVDDTVASVLAQTYQDLEVVIVHDGAAGAATNRPFAADEPSRTRVIASENRGAGSARNLAIHHARGLYICAVDAGDRLAPAYLERATRILDEDAAVSFASCWEQMLGEDHPVGKPERCDLPALLAECTVSPAALVRRSAVEAVGGYDERIPGQGYEAWDLWISVVERGFAGVIVPEGLVHRRSGGGAPRSTCRAGQADLGVMRYLFDKHRDSYQQHLFEILLRLEKEACDRLQASYALDAQIENWLVPTVRRRRDELERLRLKLATGGRLLELETALAAVQASRSWKLTAPLRAAYDLLVRLRPGSGERRASG
jgi:glycosyltransferase involved in cell wall biosynthesis